MLHPGGRWHFRVRGYIFTCILGFFGGMYTVFPILGVLGGIGGAAFGSSSGPLLAFLFFILIGLPLFVLIASEVFARMSYNRFFYEFRTHEVRIERGIIWKRYSNVSYDRIQNVDIRRGIIARMFKFSSLAIQTAGSSAGRVEGYLPAVGVGEAEQLRDFLLKKARSNRRL